MNDETETQVVGHIFTALSEVKKEINTTGVSKSRENKQQGFKYRGIDDALDAFSGPLARNDVLVTPSYEKAEFVDLQTKNTTLRLATVRGVFQLLSLRDGSSIMVGPFEGEASDVIDKALTKACSVAMRNMLFLTFTVPFIGEEDPDGDKATTETIGTSDVEPVIQSKAGGERKIDVSVSQGNLLDAKLAACGRDRDWIMDEFGAVTGQTFRAAMDFIGKYGVAAQAG